VTFVLIGQRQESSEPITERRTGSHWAGVWQSSRGIVSYQATLADTESFQGGQKCCFLLSCIILLVSELLLTQDTSAHASRLQNNAMQEAPKYFTVQCNCYWRSRNRKQCFG